MQVNLTSNPPMTGEIDGRSKLFGFSLSLRPSPPILILHPIPTPSHPHPGAENHWSITSLSPLGMPCHGSFDDIHELTLISVTGPMGVA